MSNTPVKQLKYRCFLATFATFAQQQRKPQHVLSSGEHGHDMGTAEDHQHTFIHMLHITPSFHS
jgi:hypothetical protein